MLAKVNSEAGEELNSSTNVENILKKDYLVENWEVKGTPLMIQKKGDSYAGVLGVHVITEIFKSKEEVEAWMEENSMHVVFRMMAAMIEVNNRVERHRTEADARTLEESINEL